MNLFKRARSTTGRGTGANDQQASQSSSNTPQTTPSPSLGKSDLPLPQSSSNYASNPAFSRKITYNTHEDPTPLFYASPSIARTEGGSPAGLTHPPRKRVRGTINTYDNHPDLYARNNLDTFVFGAGVPSHGYTPSPLDPNSIWGENDSEDTHLAPDTTPRPSVISTVSLNQRSDTSTPTSTFQNDRLQGVGHSDYQGDRRSIHTFGDSSASASASVSSLVGPIGSSTRLSSRVSSHSSSTPQNSNDFTFTFTSSDDDDMEHTHPLSSDVEDVPWRPNRQKMASPLFLSDDELDIYEDDDDNEPELTRRKGSTAITIVNTASGSVIPLRRGSRSLDQLHSFSSARPSGSSASRTSCGTIVPVPASSSVPQSEYEIENVRKKSLPLIVATAAGPNPNPLPSDNAGLDLSWMENFGRNGIVGFNNDDMEDIVGSDGAPPMDRDPTSNMRRHSTFSTTTVDIMLKNIQAWNSSSQKYQDQLRLWVFEKENYDSMLPPRERPSISYFFSSRSNTMTDASLIAPFLDHAHMQREKEKKLPKDSWKGMPLGMEEYWMNGWSGRFRVTRRNTSNDPETLQQRLIFSYTRNQDGHDRTATDKPTVTIHKHSKTIAFSISRTYRQKNPPRANNNNPNRPQPTTTQPLVEKKKPPILLAPRRVQVSYTSTTTTRKLESHGLLNDDGRKNMRDTERLEKAKKEREREREERRREKERETVKGKERESSNVMERAAKTFSAKSKEWEKGPLVEVRSMLERQKERVKPIEFDSAGPGLGHTESQSSSGDRSRGGSKATSSTSSSDTTLDPGEESASSVDQILAESLIPDRTLAVAQNFRRRDPTEDNNDVDYDEDDDDSFDLHRRLPHRSTYRETYATLPPEVFESNQHENTHRFFGWAKSKSDRLGPRNYLEASYNPPWLTQPKHSSITRKDIVEDLNMSFQDVGLLPAIGEIKSTSSKAKRKKNKKVKPPTPGNENRVDIQIPEDVLFMILPLWPGETDPTSAKRYPFSPPTIPVENRLYLLVYYKAMPSLDKSNKKRFKNTYDVQDDRYVFLNSFHISSRIVSYHELQGSCIRIPDHGLAICGPLQEAYNTMPNIQPSDSCIIGLCSNRDTGFEFMPDGFEKMGLSHNVPNPRLMESFTTDDDSSSMDTLAVPTPIGHAVMEMAWFGGMALSGFHRDPQWRG